MKFYFHISQNLLNSKIDFFNFCPIIKQRKSLSHLFFRRRSQLETRYYKNRDIELFEKYNKNVNKVEHFLLKRVKKQVLENLLKSRGKNQFLNTS